MGIPPIRAASNAFVLTDEPSDKERDKETDEAPETPLDEPRPPRIEDPPPQPTKKGPYVVQDPTQPTNAQETHA